MYVIYQAKNTVNGKLYVGQTKQGLEKRRKRHESCQDNSVFNRAIIKYGKVNFEWEILAECIDLKEANFMEEFLIKHLYTHFSENGYNVKMGGNNHSGTTAWNKGKKLHYGVWNRGISMAEEVKEKLSESLKGRDAWNKGIPITEECRLKISKSLKGKVPPNRKKVKCVESDTTFPSVSHAYEWVSGNRKPNSAISNTCNGKNKSAYGYTWEWVETSTTNNNYQEDK